METKTVTPHHTSTAMVMDLFNDFSSEEAKSHLRNFFTARVHSVPADISGTQLAREFFFYEKLAAVFGDLLNTGALPAGDAAAERSETRKPDLQRLINFIVEVIPVEYIFCFEQNAACIDLMVVLDKHNLKPFNEQEQVIAFAALGHPNIHCTVHTYGTMYARLLQGNLFYSMACNEGSCIYTSENKYQLPVLSAADYAEFERNSIALFKTNFKKAEGFLDGTVGYINDGNNVMAAFMLQQACELGYRTLLLAFRQKDLKLHELVVLRKHIRRFAPSVIGVFSKDEEEELRLLGILQEAYIGSRYDADYTMDEDQVSFFYNHIGLMHERIEQEYYKALKGMQRGSTT